MWGLCPQPRGGTLVFRPHRETATSHQRNHQWSCRANAELVPCPGLQKRNGGVGLQLFRLSVILKLACGRRHLRTRCKRHPDMFGPAVPWTCCRLRVMIPSDTITENTQELEAYKNTCVPLHMNYVKCRMVTGQGAVSLYAATPKRTIPVKTPQKEHLGFICRK